MWLRCTWLWLHIWFVLAGLFIWPMHTPVLLPAEGLGVYWFVDVLVEDKVVKVDMVVKDRSEEEEVRARGLAGSVV